MWEKGWKNERDVANWCQIGVQKCARYSQPSVKG